MKKLLLLSVLAGFFSACSTNNMMHDKSAENKAKVQRFYDEVINAHNPAMVDSFCTADFVNHQPDPGFTGKGSEELKENFKQFFAGFPDARITTNMMMASGDTVMSLITISGTNSGPMAGMPATNKQFNVMGTDIIVIKDGKATDRWGFSEEMKMMKQMGLMPEMPADTSRMMNQ